MELLEQVTNERRAEVMSRLFTDFQVERFNELYYQRRAAHVRKLATWVKAVSAVAASAALTGLLAGSGFGTLVLQILTGIAAISAAIGPYLGWDNKVSQLERAGLGHAIAKDRILHLLKDIKLSELTESHQAREGEIAAFRQALTSLDEPPNEDMRKSCWKTVEEEFPAEQAWSSII